MRNSTFYDTLERKLRSDIELEASAVEFFINAPCPAAIFDLETCTFLVVNKAFAKILEYAEEELVEAPMSKITHPNDLQSSTAEVESNVKTAKDLSENYTYVNRYVTKSGTVLTLKWQGWNNYSLMKSFCIVEVVKENGGTE